MFIMLLFSPICFGSLQRLEDDLKPESNVARLPHNIPKNKFKNICPCTHEMLVVLLSIQLPWQMTSLGYV